MDRDVSSLQAPGDSRVGDGSTVSSVGGRDPHRSTDARAEATLDAVGYGVLSTDAAGAVVYLNPAAAKLTGWHGAAATGRPAVEVFRVAHRDTHAPARNPTDAAMEPDKGAARVTTGVLSGRDGSRTVIEYSTAGINGPDGNAIGAVTIFRPVSSARAASQAMSCGPQTDALTGLPNAVVLLDRVGCAIELAARNDARLAVLYIDLADSQRISDPQGSAARDEFLEAVATRLETCIRASDTACRRADNGFAVLLSAITCAEDAGRVAGKLRAALGKVHRIVGREMVVTVSIGIAVYPLDGQDARTLLARANGAMREAKAHGRNCYRFAHAAMNPPRSAVVVQFPSGAAAPGLKRGGP